MRLPSTIKDRMNTPSESETLISTFLYTVSALNQVAIKRASITGRRFDAEDLTPAIAALLDAAQADQKESFLIKNQAANWCFNYLKQYYVHAEYRGTRFLNTINNTSFGYEVTSVLSLMVENPTDPIASEEDNPEAAIKLLTNISTLLSKIPGVPQEASALRQTDKKKHQGFNHCLSEERTDELAAITEALKKEVQLHQSALLQEIAAMQFEASEIETERLAIRKQKENSNESYDKDPAYQMCKKQMDRLSHTISIYQDKIEALNKLLEPLMTEPHYQIAINTFYTNLKAYEAVIKKKAVYTAADSGFLQKIEQILSRLFSIFTTSSDERFFNRLKRPDKLLKETKRAEEAKEQAEAEAENRKRI